MASGATGFMTATVQVGARLTAWTGPLAGFTVRFVPVSDCTTPRTVVGPGGVPAGWACADPAASRLAATSEAVNFILGSPSFCLRPRWDRTPAFASPG